MSFQDLFGALYGADGGAFYHKIPFENYTEDWKSSMIQIGESGWNEFYFLFFHPDGDLCGVPKGGQYAFQLVKAPPPTSSATLQQDWVINAKLVNQHDGGIQFWGREVHFLFFDPEGKLYGVVEDQLYSRSLQSNEQRLLLDSAKLLGTSGWSSFNFLFFDPVGILYGLKNGKLHKRSPPTDPTDDWLGTSVLIGTTGWRGFRFLFFMSNGELYAVAEWGESLYKESLYKGLPPTQGMPFDKWLASSTLIAKDDFNIIQFLMSPIKVWVPYFVLRLDLAERFFVSNRGGPKIYNQPELSNSFRQLKRRYILLLHKSVF